MIPATMLADAREKLQAHLLEDEGCVLHAYSDSLGYLTIGIGRLIDKRAGGGITYSEALYLLGNDIDRHWHELVEALPWVLGLNAPRQAAMANLAFNLGIPKLLKFTNTLAAIKAGDWLGAERGLRSSLWVKQVQASRSERIISMLRTGEWPRRG